MSAPAPAADSSLARRLIAIYRDSWAMYRAHLRFVIGSAAVVMVPFAILDGLGLLTFETHTTRPLVAAITVVAAVTTTGISGLAALFYAGLLDHTAEAWHDGAPAPSPKTVARDLPWVQLLIASVAAYTAELLAISIFVVPGLVLYTLFILTGPILVSEDLSAGAALRRSASLVRRHPGLVIVAVVIPSFLEGSLADFGSLVFGHDLTIELLIEVMTTLFVASFVGIVEVITAHHLQRLHPRPQRYPASSDSGTLIERD